MLNSTTKIGKSTDCRQTLLKTAVSLFAEKGFEAVSMRMIAERANISKANVFHHFGSKESLYLAVMREAINQSTTSLQRTSNSNDSATQRLQGFSAQHLKVLLDNPDRSRLILREVLDTQANRGQKIADEVVGEGFSQLVKLLQKGQTAGEFRGDFDPALAAALFVAADVFFFEAAPILKHLPDVSFADKPSHYTAGLMDIFLHGIAPKNKTN